MSATMDDLLVEMQRTNTYLRGGGNSSAQASSYKTAPNFSNNSGSVLSDGITGVFGKFKQGADNVLADWRQSQSTFGIGMSNDAIGLRNSAIMTRMTMQEWGESIEVGRIGFTSLGGTMNESAKVFNQMSMKFSDTTASDNLAKMGYTTSDYNKLLSITITNNRQLNLQKEEDQQKVIQATEKLGKEMDKVSQLSGVSRKEQMDKMEKDRSDMQYQSRLKLMQLEGKGEGVTGLTSIGNQAMMTGTADLVKNLAEGGKLTEKSRDQLQLMGGDLAGKYESAVKDMTNASTAAEREAAEARFKVVNAEVAARMSSKEMLEYSAMGANKQVEVLREQQLAATNYSDAIKKTMEDRKLSEEEARQYLEKTAGLAQTGKGMKDGKEVDVAGAQTTEAMVLSGRRLDDAGVKLAQAAQAANEAGGKNLKNSEVMKNLQNLNAEGKPFSKTAYGEAGDNIIKSINSGTFFKDFGKNSADAIQQALKGITTITAEVIKLSGTVASEDGKMPFTSSVPGKEIPVPGGSHASGTKESFGNWFGKDFGSGMLAKLHGSEAVVPEGKIEEFITDMQKQIMGNIGNTGDASSQQDDQFKTMLSKMQSSDFSNPTEITQSPTNINQPVEQAVSPVASGSVTLKDLNDQLTKLNTTMVKLVMNTSDMVDTSSKQYRATKQLSPNINAR